MAELGQKEGKEKDKKLKELLNKSFLVVKIKALRPVVMAVMKHLTHVDEKYLKVLVCPCRPNFPLFAPYFQILLKK